MERLVFVGPDACETLFDPTVDQMVAILRRGPAYWGRSSGDACLRWCLDQRDAGQGWQSIPADEWPKLSILFNETHGFHLAYSGPEHSFIVPFDATAPDLRVLHYVCGNQAFFSQACFVPVAVAEQAVRDFLTDGGPSPAIHWRNGAELRCGDTDG